MQWLLLLLLAERCKSDAGAGSEDFYSQSVLDGLERDVDAYLDSNKGSDTTGCGFTLADPVWVVSLKSRPDRRERILPNLSSKLTREYRMFDAIDGRDLPKIDQVRFRHARHFSHKLSSGMKGCILSHQSIWANITAGSSSTSNNRNNRTQDNAGKKEQSGAKSRRFHLILEDDADFPADLEEKISSLFKISPCDTEVLYLGSCYRRLQNRVVGPTPIQNHGQRDKQKSLEPKFRSEHDRSETSEYSLYTARRVLCTHAYLLTETAASVLLDATLDPYDTLDQMMNNAQITGKIRSYVVQPDVVTQYDSASDILNPTTPNKKYDAHFVVNDINDGDAALETLAEGTLTKLPI